MINVLVVQELLKAGDEYLGSEKGPDQERRSILLKSLNEKGMTGVTEKEHQGRCSF
jgi:hypothetical protein